jgi:hypothetical protein
MIYGSNFLKQKPIYHIPQLLIKSRMHEEQDSKRISSYNWDRNNLYIDYLNNLNRKNILEFETSEARFYIIMTLYLTSASYI